MLVLILVNTIIVADITNLQNRGLVNSLMASPFILNAFIAGYITEGISAFTENGWRWGVSLFFGQAYGSMECLSFLFQSAFHLLSLFSSGQTVKLVELEVCLYFA